MESHTSEDDGEAEIGGVNKQSLGEDHKKKDAQNGNTQSHDPTLIMEDIGAERTDHDVRTRDEKRVEPSTTVLDLEASSGRCLPDLRWIYENLICENAFVIDFGHRLSWHTVC